jgi:hypothetical protein
MPTITGNFGKIKYGAGTVGAAAYAEVKEFSIEESVAVIDDGVMGDDYETHLTGRKKWSGKMTCNYDAADTNGQLTLLPGSSFGAKLFPDNDTTGKRFFSGNATVTQITVMTKLDDIVTFECSFTGNGALTRSTVA